MLPLHFWRIHARVARRLWTDIPQRLRDIIAADADHETPEYKWFESKTKEDAQRLFEDPNYYDNAEYSFRVPKYERVEPLTA